MQPSVSGSSRNTSKSSGTGGTGDAKDIIEIHQTRSQNANISFTTAAPSDTSKTKQRRRCLRLDIWHSRDLFVTIFYRIWMYRRRHVFLTLLQLLISPIILIGMTAYLGTMLDSSLMNRTDYAALDEPALQEEICGDACATGGPMKAFVAYYMTNNRTRFAVELKNQMEAHFKNYDIHLIEKSKADDLVDSAIQYQLKGQPEEFIAGIEIDNPPTDAQNTMYGVGDNFKIHFTVAMAQKLPGFTFQATPVFFDLRRNDPTKYYKLLGIELAVCRSLYAIFANEYAAASGAPDKSIRHPSISIKSMSYPKHRSYTLKPQFEKLLGGFAEDFEEYQGIDPMLATIFVLSMIPVVFTVVEGPVSEKENGFKLYLQLMGFPRAAYWFHWILNQMLVQLVVIAAQVWLIFSPFNSRTGPLVKYGDPTLWFVVLVLFNLSSLSFFTFFAAFGRRSKMTTYITILIWLLSFNELQSHVFDFNSSFTLFMISCLIPSGCIHWSVYIFTSVNSWTWDISVNFSVTQKSGFKLADVMIMMVIIYFVYFLLTLYVDNLNPGPMEVGQPWNYFFESIRCRFIDPDMDIEDKISVNSDFHLQRSIPSIEFKKLSKKFYLIDGIYGIENAQFNVHPGAITVLLGHKDSGKTTLMRLLCGAYAPSSGTVIVCGYDVKKDAQKVQSLLNVCMQNDMLCEYLTVMEHMKLIAKLKGLKRKKAKAECRKILDFLGLLLLKNSKMWQLAKWQRRVLCVAMALIGDVPILVLDAPTAGLDLDAKRQIWTVLKDLKSRGKTILMSSQDIEEANYIADRIVIMSRGRIAGVGSPSKLENFFETGYHLNLITIPNVNFEELLAFLKTHVPTVREREGGLKRVKKALLEQNWAQHSQTAIRQKSKTVVEIPLGLKEMGGTLGKLFPALSLDAEVLKQKSFRTIGFRNKTPYQSKTTIKQAPSVDTHINNSVDPEPGQDSEKGEPSDYGIGMQICYLLPARERANFPALFRDLNEINTLMKLGIRDYDLKWHSIENAFDEVDDYVDVLDAASRSTGDIQLDEFVDTKTQALQILTGLYEEEPMPEHQFYRRKRCCSCCGGLWAIIIKRLCHVVGNYRLFLCQVLAPIIILLISIGSTNVHFSHDLLSTEIAYNTSSELIAPTIPYRFSGGASQQDFFESYKKIAGKPPNSIKVFKSIGTDEFTHHYNEKNWHKLHDEVLIAADFTNLDNPKESSVTALFSPGHRHSAPLSLLLMFNALLDYEFRGKNYMISMSGRSMLHERQYNILINNKTLVQNIITSGVDLTLTVSLTFGYFIFASGFVSQPCSERLCHIKRYQMYNLEWNGLYWIASMIVDCLVNIVMITLLALVLYFAPAHNLFKNPQFIILFGITGFVGGFAAIMGSYYRSYHWKRKSTSYYATLSLNQFLGLFLFVLYTIINFDYIGHYADKVAAFCLQILNPFTITWNFHEDILWALKTGRCRVVNPRMTKELCASSSSFSNLKSVQEECCNVKKGAKQWSFAFIRNNKNEGITPLWTNVSFLCLHCIIGSLILMSLESRRSRRKIFFLLSHHEDPPALINRRNSQSIEAEAVFIREGVLKLCQSDREKLFIVYNLSTSVFNRVLLHPMSFAVLPGKCLVIVGPETSGITVLYEILAGIRAVSEGSVRYGGYSLLSWGTRRKFLQQLGLSPSHDITMNKLTGKQLLALFGRLRGIPSNRLSEHIDYWVETLSLGKKIGKHCSSYSVVVKKKLSIACAAIGNPPVLIFDEPTKDLDPLSRSDVCKVIANLIAANRVVIILTHDLASVQHLCSKLIFLVNGQIQFCENVENILNDIADEFTLTIKLKGDERGKIDFKAFAQFVTDLEDGIERMTLQEEQSHTLMYRIKNPKYNWADLFEIVEKVVSNHEDIVADYNIRRRSLEDVYHFYAVKQRVYRSSMPVWEEFRTTYC